MNILMISEGNITYDGRLLELYNSTKNIGHVKLISIADNEDDKIDSNHQIIKRRNGKFKKLIYILKSYLLAKKDKFDVLFIDNSAACVVGLIIIRFIKPKIVILDSRELYLKNEPMSWKMKAITFFERLVIKKADIHICANKYRANLMKETYNLRKLPVIFENIRMITEEPEVDYNYVDLLNNSGIIRLISTGGLSRERAWPIIQTMKSLGDDYQLFILGKASESEMRTANQMIKEMDLKNVFIVGKVRRSVMRYFIQQCDIGVVYYSGKNTNERLCASGKIYEYMQEGKPFIGADLLPLADLCKEHGIGECDWSLADAIQKVKNNYEDYQKNVVKYIDQIDVLQNNQYLAEQLKSRIDDL